MNLAAAAVTNRWTALPWISIPGPSTRDPREAWKELADIRAAPDWQPLFHVRRRGRRRLWRQLRQSTITLRVNPSIVIPPAHYVDVPLSVDDAALFSANAARVRRAEALASELCARLDVLGAPTFAGTRRPPPLERRRVVWTRRRRPWQCERSVLLLMKLLVWELVDRSRSGTFVPAVEELVGAPVPHQYWWGATPVCSIALGALAWRALAARGNAMPPTLDDCGARLYVRNSAAGRALSELANPFDPLLELLELGVELIGIGEDAVALGVEPGTRPACPIMPIRLVR